MSAKKKQKNQVKLFWYQAGQPKPSFPARVTLTRLSPGRLDPDNLPNSFKYVTDELCRCFGLIHGDGEPKLDKRGRLITPRAKDDGDEVDWCFAQERSKKKWIRVRVEEM